MEAYAKAPTSSAAFWTTTTASPAAAFAFNLNNEEEQATEALFEKPLTPSDVGKLNRLVIPKQHAEKYFPMNGGGGDSGEKGLLLGFEDEVGQQWRFRYSYWNSSQSYVLTKGWSRFVKEKRLDAGDVVLFSRHYKDVDRLFIGWRRRRMSCGGGGQDGCVARGGGWSGYPYPPSHHQLAILPHTDCPHAENERRGRNGNLKRMRLFGVNLEWDEDETEYEQVHQDPCHEYYSSHNRTNHTTITYMFDSTNT